MNEQTVLRGKHCLKMEKAAGSATYKQKVKQYESHSWKQREIVSLDREFSFEAIFIFFPKIS